MNERVTYEQAIRLKDAGYPQPGDVDKHSMDSRFINGVYAPTFEEMANQLPFYPKEDTLDAAVELYVSLELNKD